MWHLQFVELNIKIRNGILCDIFNCGIKYNVKVDVSSLSAHFIYLDSCQLWCSAFLFLILKFYLNIFLRSFSFSFYLKDLKRFYKDLLGFDDYFNFCTMLKKIFKGLSHHNLKDIFIFYENCRITCSCKKFFIFKIYFCWVWNSRVPCISTVM